MIGSRKLSRLFKFFIISFAVLLIIVLIQTPKDETAPIVDPNPLAIHSAPLSVNSSSSNKIPNPGILNLSSEPQYASPVDLQTVVKSLKFLNDRHKILNEDKYGAVNPDNIDFVIVVQVHNRLEYLEYLIKTLQNASNINHTLLIFSHDMNVPEINSLIQSITFCRVIQIFYPHNIQLFPHIFPGQSPNDCPEKIPRVQADAINCTNHDHPDKYGNYRVAQLTQIKHHWWWKMNYVFDGIVKRYDLTSKYVLLLEEDHYVSPDALVFLYQMINSKSELCEECDVLCLGFYLKNYRSYANDIDKVSIQAWYSSKHNMGFAINSTTWDKIRNCSEIFCKGIDDYNWDWSLLHVSLKCLNPRMRVMVAKAPRVIHVGDCGVHTHRCQAHSAAENARQLFETHSSILFPKKLTRSEILKRMLKPSKPNGGWGDVRDHELCLNNTYPYQPDKIPTGS